MNSETSIANTCQVISVTLEEQLQWKWDSRFETALAEFQTVDQEIVEQAIGQFLTAVWDPSTIDDAPEEIQLIVGQFGGLMPGQRFFHSDLSQEEFLFAAWWPWGNGTTISLRVAPCMKQDVNIEPEQKMEEFRGWFGLA